jgi:UDP-N-acetyl-D-mannosaminuronic acid dehydrogenase
MSELPLSCCVVGLGYIGLPTAALIASRNIPVLGVDIRPDVVDIINAGSIHIVEPDLDGLVHHTVRTGLLKAALLPAPAKVFVIAVPTPIDDQKRPDLAAIRAATASIATSLKAGDLVILESTSPVGTTDQMVTQLRSLRPDLIIAGEGQEEAMVSVAYCPERVLPGKIISELIQNDRCVGGITPLCTKRALAFYRRFVTGACIGTTARTAELVKLSENAFRDINIAYANSLSRIADRHEIDVWEVIELANRHPRVNILKPGPGVGGHCIAVDPWFIVHSAPEESALIRTGREINDAKPGLVIREVEERLAALPATARIACFGLAFKANIDDLRESPALEITEVLAQRYKDRVIVAEPYVEALPASLTAHGARLLDTEEAVRSGDVLVLLVDHDAFRTVDPALFAGKDIVDTRGLWQRKASRKPA